MGQILVLIKQCGYLSVLLRVVLESAGDVPVPAAFGYEEMSKQPFYGLHVHIGVCWLRVMGDAGLALANAHELGALLGFAEPTSGLILGDRNYHSPKSKKELAYMGVELLAPFSSKKLNPNPETSPSSAALASA